MEKKKELMEKFEGEIDECGGDQRKNGNLSYSFGRHQLVEF